MIGPRFEHGLPGWRVARDNICLIAVPPCLPQALQPVGVKNHVRIQSTLPCGWANQILIHKQARLKEMKPQEPFCLLHYGLLSPSNGPIPPLLYARFNKCLALPLLENWAEYLWENGRERNLIMLLD
jgi:hypothetical protein